MNIVATAARLDHKIDVTVAKSYLCTDWRYPSVVHLVVALHYNVSFDCYVQCLITVS